MAALVLVGLGGMQSATAADPPVVHKVDPMASVAKAIDRLAGPFPAGAFEFIEDLAWRGDGRAQLLMGSAYVDGKLVPGDLPRGYAWLQLAVGDDPWRYSTEGTTAKAREVGNQLAGVLTGQQMIAGERIAASLRDEMRRAWQADVSRQVRLLTGQDPESIDPFVLTRTATHVVRIDSTRATDTMRAGCASEPDINSCNLPRGFSARTHCTGELIAPDAEADFKAAGAYLRQPIYPDSARLEGVEGRVGMLVHIDDSGYVCSVTMFRTSGVPSLDRSAVDAVRFWRAAPARKADRAVESLQLISATFMISGYSFTSPN